jgi:RimJ/RimL family protein N-acetyltransferase
MSFFRLKKIRFHIAKKNYYSEKRRYPLIGAVLNSTQEGVVFANDKHHPTSFFIEHKFGFSQIFGDRDTDFYHGLRQYLFVDQAFTPQKIRLYAPDRSYFFQGCAELSERCQFRLKDDLMVELKPNLENLSIENVTIHNAEKVDQIFKLDLFSRFWDNKEDFLKHGMAKVLKYHEKPASICYAATISDNIAEIDVATLPEYRKHNFGRFACSAFIRTCLDTGIVPNWDCFTNNVGSMRLAESLGFVKYGEPYAFFTLNKSNKE